MRPARTARPPLSGRLVAVVVALAVIALVLWLRSWSGTVYDPPAAEPHAATTVTSTVRDPESGLRWVDLSSLPSQVATAVRLIQRGGPFPYSRDGVTFGNNERILPRHPSGYYREYTVPTPGSDDRGARRIVTGAGDTQFFYTTDHYNSFVRIRV